MITKSINFEILREQWPKLSKFGGLSEQYVHTDPESALIKMRSFVEHLVEWLYLFHNLPLTYQPKLFDLLILDAFKEVVPTGLLSKMHLIRISGNRAAHGQETDGTTALALLRDTYDLSFWLFITYGRDKMAEYSV